ncbi:hypothetical protein Bhyg_11848, partial [Pseudolycoriella hygida]
MDCLSGIKLEPRVQDDDLIQFPCSSESLSSSAPLSRRINVCDSDSDGSLDEDVSDVVNIHDRLVEVVDIESDTSNEEEEEPVFQTPRKAGLRQLAKRSFKESDSDNSDEGVKKCPKFSDPEKLYNVLSEPCKLLKKLKKNRMEADVLLEKYVRCTIDGIALSHRKLYDEEMEALREIFENYGKIFERLSLNKFYWDESKVISNFSPFNIYALITKLCPNLYVLKFAGAFGAIKLMKSPSKPILFANLREICYTCGDIETASGNDRNIVLHTIYSQIFKGATSLERLDYKFLHLHEADQVLEAMKDSSKETNMKCFKRLQLKCDKEITFEEKQISALSLINAPNLEHLELGNGLWENVKAKTFEKMLSNFPKLQTLIIHGNRQGDSSSPKDDFSINFPRLDKLVTLSIGAEYEFESIIQTSTSNVVSMDDTQLELLKSQIRFPHMPNLRSISLGNLINIDELRFKNFPNLEVFKVGGPWNTTCNFLVEEPHLKVRDLQFPDALKDSSLSSRIPQLFPSLKRLWIFLPSIVCLRAFFKAMSTAKNVKIEELHIKSQFDFESTLESCLLGRSTATMRSKQDIRNLKLLQKYTFFDDYVKYYNIELPIVKDEENEEKSSPGIGVLKSLKILQLEHVPRILRIPTGKFHWLDYRCILSNDFIGYRRYPLSEKCINELHIKNLHTFLWPNFEVKTSRFF